MTGLYPCGIWRKWTGLESIVLRPSNRSELLIPVYEARLSPSQQPSYGAPSLLSLLPPLS